MLQFLEASTDADRSENNIECEDEPTTNLENGDVQLVNNDEDALESRPSSSAFRRDSATTGHSKFKRQNVVHPDDLLKQASKTMAEMSQIAKERSYKVPNEDSFETFGKFVATELRSISDECNNAYLVRHAKRKIQHILMETWDTVESTSQACIQSLSNSHSIIVENSTGFSDDVIATAIKLSNLNYSPVNDNNIETGN